jgi:hypothetical protein
LGNRAWFDKNGNGIQDPDEPGIGGICVTLFDASGTSLQTTSTDTNGYYGFNIEPGLMYTIGFEDPANLDFTQRDVGMDDQDSDIDPTTGWSDPFTASSTDLNWDAGYLAHSRRNSTLQMEAFRLPPASGSDPTTPAMVRSKIFPEAALISQWRSIQSSSKLQAYGDDSRPHCVADITTCETWLNRILKITRTIIRQVQRPPPMAFQQAVERFGTSRTNRNITTTHFA